MDNDSASIVGLFHNLMKLLTHNRDFYERVLLLVSDGVPYTVKAGKLQNLHFQNYYTLRTLHTAFIK